MIEVRVPEKLAGERADKVVAALGGMSRAQARALFEGGGVRAGAGGALAPRDRLAAGEVVVFEPPPEVEGLRPEPVAFDVRHEDEHLLVVDKPAGVVVHPGAGRREGTLAAGLLHRYPELEGVGEEGRWGIVHHPDRDTSGLLVVARTAEAHRRLTRMLAAREVTRTYLTLVLGTFDAPRGTIDAPIGRDPARPTRRRVMADGRPARTHYRLVEQWDPPGVALLEVTLETGRTHQIRVHLASIDHPVVGDRVYGRPGRVEAPRVFLHASRLSLPHPLLEGRVEVESELPDDLRAVVEGLPAR